MPRKILFVPPFAGFFLSHRLPLAHAAIAQGYEVVVACPLDADVRLLEAEGIPHRTVPISRTIGGLGRELQTLVALWRLFRRERPDVVHLITAKPALHGGIAARLLGIPSVAAITGLGSVFVGTDWRSAMLRRLILAGYRLGLNHEHNHFIFQNTHDEQLFREQGLLERAGDTLIRGSGADLEQLSPEPLSPGIPTVVMPCRMLREKGVYEFVGAAQLLRERGVEARFILVGDPDPANPKSLTTDELQAISRDGVVEWRPFTKQIAEVLAQAHVVALPSYYREGLPKTLIDAAAAGRAMVTTDTPGCRDAVIHGETGLICPPRDPVALADCLQRIVTSPGAMRDMGQAARRFAEAHFDVRDVAAEHLRIYRAAIADTGGRET
jgi:glycosyltransferase involved in cell wall biosynthesis